MNARELSRLKAIQQQYLIDSCTVDVYSSGSSEYSDITESVWTSGCQISCGYQPNPGNKLYNQNAVLQSYNAVFRIPEDTTITSDDKITLTKISGCSVNPIQYQIVSIEQGHGLLIVGCKGVQS
jgi:hypothetical protein